jgi:hypothetical protein
MVRFMVRMLNQPFPGFIFRLSPRSEGNTGTRYVFTWFRPATLSPQVWGIGIMSHLLSLHWARRRQIGAPYQDISV